MRMPVGVWGYAGAGVLLVAMGVRAQQTDSKRMAADAHPALEVAAIKQSDPKPRNSGIRMHGRHFNIENQTVENLMLFGFGASRSQILSAPGWVD
ncbi:MAG TPA: hypothetical protein VJU82_09725 [Acidobacteriaceae bacterium]|nr:hypothetical protein [Acidobacteriaceae bacterium]